MYMNIPISKISILLEKLQPLLRQALTPDAVLFSFPPNTFVHRCHAYEAIEKQVGPVDGFRPLSRYDVRAHGNLLIEAKFQDPDHTKLAIKNGITVEDNIYKGFPSVLGAENPLVRVQLTLLRNVNGEELKKGLLSSLRYYGKVYQIRQILCNGYFEGQLTITLDPSVGYTDDNGEQRSAQPLQRMLYLETWDTFTTASLKGAAPICYYCRQAGHIRNACPELAKRVCFGCGERGHTKRLCRVKPTETELLDSYIDHTSSSNKVPTTQGDEEPDNKDLHQPEHLKLYEEEPDKSPKDAMDEDETNTTIADDTEMTEAPQDTKSKSQLKHSDPGTSIFASKHAPIEVASTMRVDTAEEMLELSKIDSKTKVKNDKIRGSINKNTTSATKAHGSVLSTSKTDIKLTPVIPWGTPSSSKAHRAQ
ncbi:hypothetical protein RO3G_14635 [Lichtheimia corymbifera JMRC:FSU:9682]|uniref:CCHC-type domain-containing protein n=1 Tax=Lichtheimia corymbifera JMRC:FSU:9682 TaxID=1263082 RepID=A0A068SGN6_9FUNG|nr:hypothetical protein RO3G_14635 [Lichtheimia corymbifera JMRC:FSU:9682]